MRFAPIFDQVPRILVIDEHPIIRKGIIAVLVRELERMDVSGAGSFSEALIRIGDHSIDLVITDFQVSGETALWFLKNLSIAKHRTRCLILSGSDEIQVGYPCVKAGASGFIAKSSPVAGILDAAKTIMAGHHYVSERLAKALMNSLASGAQPSAEVRLTPRELEIFSLIGEGLAVSSVAVQLGLSVKTVESHRENIKNKLGHQSAVHLAAAAVRWREDTSLAIQPTR